MQEQPPTRAEFNRLVEQVKRLEQETEPMRLERRLSIPEANTLQQTFEGVARANTNIGVLQQQMEGARADITAIKESQADFRDKLIEQGTKLDRMESSLSRIAVFLESKGME